MKKNMVFKLPLCFLLFALTSCSGVKETLGLTREVPDEFEVSSHKTLEMPSEDSSMETKPADQELKRVDLGKLIGTNKTHSKIKQSQSEKQFLSMLGAHSGKDIRHTVNQETEQLLTTTQEIQQKAKDVIMFLED